MRTGRVVGSELTLWICALTLVITSAIWTKERGALPALAGVNAVEPVGLDAESGFESGSESENAASTSPIVSPTTLPTISSVALVQSADGDVRAFEPNQEPEVSFTVVDAQDAGIDTSIRWFDGKAVRPAKVMYMTVTGYSPDARSCGKYADNKTATMNSVWTNGMNLVAADPKLLPYWSIISVPGYANGEIVPVLDCGGAIKGNRLDLLYPTHERALQWGIRDLPITIWEYVEDGQ